MISKVIWLILLVIPLLLQPFCNSAHASEASEPSKQEKLSIGILQNHFLGVNSLDAEAAFKIFARTVALTYGYQIDVTVRMFESTRELQSVPLVERIDLIVLDTWSYLKMKDEKWLEPVFVSSDGDQMACRYLLLTRRESKLNTLKDLRGKTLNLLASSNAMLGIPWLQGLMQEHELGMPEEFFGVMEYYTQPMPTVLPVFFGKKDAALIDATKFELMIELNPQLKSLQTIGSSEPLVNSVVCLKRSGWSSERFRQDLVQAMAELHLKPSGQQILALFKIGRMVPFEQSQLDTVIQLREMALSRKNKNPGAPGRLEKSHGGGI
ncbi:MAG: phosphate/phosphite/phosphonate ABC transporter substrate-binding protein [Desulfobacteraceae bacterium]|nr:phosphate/phosphite/phosphonate ABC transporter substrate-binding protein [Desulfobacteraceae bacterium]MBU4054264.1 phosphate/phosphite/phosphonate ABC transporter substrate-binding protein [Pseudomonadota bacterium]